MAVTLSVVIIHRCRKCKLCCDISAHVSVHLSVQRVLLLLLFFDVVIGIIIKILHNVHETYKLVMCGIDCFFISVRFEFGSLKKTRIWFRMSLVQFRSKKTLFGLDIIQSAPHKRASVKSKPRLSACDTHGPVSDAAN